MLVGFPVRRGPMATIAVSLDRNWFWHITSQTCWSLTGGFLKHVEALLWLWLGDASKHCCQSLVHRNFSYCIHSDYYVIYFLDTTEHNRCPSYHDVGYVDYEHVQTINFTRTTSIKFSESFGREGEWSEVNKYLLQINICYRETSILQFIR